MKNVFLALLSLFATSSLDCMLMRLSCVKSLKSLSVKPFATITGTPLSLKNPSIAINDCSGEQDCSLVEAVMKEGKGLLYSSADSCASTLKSFHEDTESYKKIIRLSGKAAGFVKYTMDVSDTKVACTINLIGIAQEFQGKKLGTYVLDHIITEAQLSAGNSKDLEILLLVYLDNLKAQQLYVKKGFVYAGTFGSCYLMKYAVRSESLARKRKDMVARLVAVGGFGLAAYLVASESLSRESI